VTFLERVANDVGLFLAPMEMPADGRHHVGTTPWTAFPHGVGLDVLVE
jgi:hypothetical protein